MIRSRKTAGISLIALVITIIVLLILTAAVVVTFREGGIMDRAKEAVFKNDIQTYQEILLIKNTENQIDSAVGEEVEELNGTTLAEMQAILPEFKEEYEGIVEIVNGELVLGANVQGEDIADEYALYAEWLNELGIGLAELSENAIVNYVEVGDYVVYDTNESITNYQLLGKDSGYFDNTSSDKQLLDQTITKNETVNWRVLKNDGNNVTLISEDSIEKVGLGGKEAYLNGANILDEICSSFYGGSKGVSRNLKVKDINEIMKLDFNEQDSYTASEYITEENSDEYKLIFRNREDTDYINTFYLSSPYESDELLSVYFATQSIITYTPDLYYSEDNKMAWTQSYRPIVILNYNVEVVDTAAGGDTLETAWQLK